VAGDTGTARSRPLYKGSRDASLASAPAGNAGLWYDKFCNRWNKDWDGLGDTGKRDWIAKVANLDGAAANRVGDAALLPELVRRQEALARGLGGQTFRLATAWRFVSGLGRSHPVENGFAWHHGLGVPYLPGSGVKGVARAWAGWAELGQDGIDRMFGPRAELDAALRAGSVSFLDALPVAPVALGGDVMTPHYGPWYQQDALNKCKVPGDWHSPTPIPFLTVARDQTFQFALMPRTPADQADCEQAAALLKESLATLGAGAKTAAGYGVFGESAFEQGSRSTEPDQPAASMVSGKTPPRLPSGTLVLARLTGKNKKNKWKAIHEESGAEAVIEGDPPEGCEVDQVHELFCTTGTNFKWPNDGDRQRLHVTAKQKSKPTGKDRHGRRR